MPANDLKELTAWLMANPDKASLGYIGPGSPAHVAGILFQKQTGTRFQFVTYRSAGQAMQDMIAGHIDLMFVNPNIALEHVRAGSIKAYAVTAKNRMAGPWTRRDCPDSMPHPGLRSGHPRARQES